MHKVTTRLAPILAALSMLGAARADVVTDLTGAWSLVSNVIEDSGKRFEPFGPNPKGLFYFDGNRFSVVIVRADLPKIESNNRMTGKPEEYSAIVQGSLAVFGRYTLNSAGEMTQSIEASTFPNWAGTSQKRTIKITDDNLVIINPAGSAGGVATVTLKRIK